MRQRAMIAMSIANEPDVLIADEPTTALDVTIQAQVLEVLERIKDRTKSSIILITHDLGVVAGVTDRVMVMYAGRQVGAGRGRGDLLPTASPVHAGAARVVAPPRPPRRSMSGCTASRVSRRHSSILPPGCAFNPRCPHARAGVCDTEVPPLVTIGPDHVAACLRVDEIPAELPS